MPPPGPPRGPPGVPGAPGPRGPRGPRGLPPRGPPPAGLMERARKQQDGVGESATDKAKVAIPDPANKPKKKKELIAAYDALHAEFELKKQAHGDLEAKVKELTRERDELREDFDALNDDFQNVRTDVSKAEKKAEEHLENMKEMRNDNAGILMGNESLRTLALIAYHGVRDIEEILVLATGSRKTNDTVELRQKVMRAEEALAETRAQQAKLREALVAMDVDIFTQEEKDMMALTQAAGTEASVAATKVQSLYRGKQSRKDFEEKRQAATKVQSRVRGRIARKQTRRENDERSEAATRVQSHVRGRLARNGAGGKSADAVKENAENSRALAAEKRKVEDLRTKVQLLNKEMRALKKQLKEMKRNSTKQRSGGGKVSSPALDFEDDEEANEAAIKVQAQIRRKQTQKEFSSKQERMRFEKQRRTLTKKARRAEALEAEVKRLRDRVVELTVEKENAEEAGRSAARSEYEEELERRERTTTKPKKTTVDIAMFEATAQELDMAQTKLAQTRSDLEQERKRNMRLHRLRLAAEEEIEKAKETINLLGAQMDRERERCNDMENQLVTMQQSNAEEVAKQQQQVPAPNVEALVQQLRLSEDGRMGALMEVQRLRTQLGMTHEQSNDATLELQQIQEDLNLAREQKSRTEMQMLKLQGELETKSSELRAAQRQITSLTRRLQQAQSEVNQNWSKVFSSQNMLTAQQQQQSGRAMVSMVGTMPQLPANQNVVRVGGAAWQKQRDMAGPEINLMPDLGGSGSLDASQGSVARRQVAVRGSGYAALHRRPGDETSNMKKPVRPERVSPGNRRGTQKRISPQNRRNGNLRRLDRRRRPQQGRNLR